MRVPDDLEIQIRPRSGLAAKSNVSVLNTPGTIDSDYRGEIKIILINHGNEKFDVKNGDRIAQMVLMPVLKFKFEEVSKLDDTIRGLVDLVQQANEFKLNKNQLKRFSRQIVLKNIGVLGQKKIIQSKVLIIGMGGLGCPAAEFLTRAGVGKIGLVDFDKVDLSNIHRQSLYDNGDLNKSKVLSAKIKLKRINSNTKIDCYDLKLNQKNCKSIFKNYEYIVDGSDNFETNF